MFILWHENFIIPMLSLLRKNSNHFVFFQIYAYNNSLSFEKKKKRESILLMNTSRYDETNNMLRMSGVNSTNPTALNHVTDKTSSQSWLLSESASDTISLWASVFGRFMDEKAILVIKARDFLLKKYLQIIAWFSFSLEFANFISMSFLYFLQYYFIFRRVNISLYVSTFWVGLFLV